MSKKIAVVGATGRVGRPVVELLSEQGHEPVSIARSLGVDVITGDGLDAALEGVEVIIDAATQSTPDEAAATEFFTTAVRNLAAAGERAGVRRVIVVSIIGIERYSAGYNAAKLAHERAWLDTAFDVRILRAAQFHEFIGEVVQWGRQGDVAYVWPMRTQPVEARYVAESLVWLALNEPAEGGPIWEIAGPRAERLADLARLLANGEFEVQEVVNEADPDAAVYDSDAPLPGPNARIAGPTFADWLKQAA